MKKKVIVWLVVLLFSVVGGFVAMFYGMEVIYRILSCYGLRTDFQNHLFTGSKRLMEIADVIEEVPTVCWCGKRAQCNVRHSNGKIVREGEQIMLGANESYVALCRKHYKEGKLWDKL